MIFVINDGFRRPFWFSSEGLVTTCLLLCASVKNNCNAFNISPLMHSGNRVRFVHKLYLVSFSVLFCDYGIGFANCMCRFLVFVVSIAKLRSLNTWVDSACVFVRQICNLLPTTFFVLHLSASFLSAFPFSNYVKFFRPIEIFKIVTPTWHPWFSFAFFGCLRIWQTSNFFHLVFRVIEIFLSVASGYSSSHAIICSKKGYKTQGSKLQS